MALCHFKLHTGIQSGVDCDLLRFDATGLGDPPIVDMGAYEFQVEDTCPADVNDDAGVNVADAAYLLQYLFANGPPPAMPFPRAGEDVTPDQLPCSL